MLARVERDKEDQYGLVVGELRDECCIKGQCCLCARIKANCCYVESEGRKAKDAELNTSKLMFVTLLL